jgi:hypothetical protein
MTEREGSLEIIEHTQSVNVNQSSMEVMQSTETNEDVAPDADDMDMSDAEALSDGSDLADSPSAQLVPQSAENEQQNVDDSEEEESSETSSEPEVSGSTTTMVAGPSASAANDQTTSPNVASVAQAQPTPSITPKSSSFLSRFNIFRSAQKLAQPERAQSEGAQSPTLDSAAPVAVEPATPQQPTSPTPRRAPATVSSSYDYSYLVDRGIGPGMFNKRLAAYRPGLPLQPTQQDVDDEEDSEDEFTRRYEERQEQGNQPRLFSNKTELGLIKANHEQFKEIVSNSPIIKPRLPVLIAVQEQFKEEKKQTARTIKQMAQNAKQMEQSMALKSKQMFLPATSTRPEKVLTDVADIEEIREVIENHLSRKAEQQIGSASKTTNIELLVEETGPVGTSHDTAAVVPTIDTATSPSNHPTSNSPAEVPALNSTVNLPAADQQVVTNASPITNSFVDENMEVDGAVDVTEPLTPTPATEPSKKSYWSAATAKIRSLATPLFIFGERGQPAANAALANNNEADTTQFTYEQSIDLGDTPTRRPNKRRPRNAGQPKPSTTFTSQQKRPEPKRRIPKSHTPSKDAGAGRSRLQNETPEKVLTLEDAEKAEKARLAKVREKLDNMTPEEKAAHDLKTIEWETKMRQHRERRDAAMAESDSRKRRSGLAFGDDEVSSRSPSKKVMIKRNEGQWKFPSLDEEHALNALVDEENAAAAAKAKTLAKGKSPMKYTSTTPLSSGGSPMSIDSPPTMLSEDLPAELRHPLDRGPDDLYYRQVELIQACMTDAERKCDDADRAKDFGLWKLLNKVHGNVTEFEDLREWEHYCAGVRGRSYWGTNGLGEKGLESQKEGFMMKKKAEREKVQLQDIENRKKELFALDPTNIFLRAQQQEEAQEIDPDEFNHEGHFEVPDYVVDDEDDEEGSDTAAKDPQQSVDDQAANTPPPPPRPGNAQLPQQSASAGIGMSYLKHVPPVPSKLRHVQEMSPLQIKEKEQARRESGGVQDKENNPPGTLKQQFMDFIEPYMDENGVPGGWVEEYDYGVEDVVRDLEEAYAMGMDGMEF